MPESFRFTGDVQGVGLRKTLHRMLDEAKLPGLAYNDPYSDTVVAQIGGRAAARKKVIDSLSGYLSGRGQFTMEPITHKEPVKKIELDDKGVRNMFERQNFDQALAKHDAQGLRNWIIERYRLKQMQDKLHGRVPLMAYKQLVGEEPIYAEQLTGTHKNAASRLRSLFNVLPKGLDVDKNLENVIRLGNKPIGSLVLAQHQGKPQIAAVDIQEKFRGMGLGRKLYGDLLRQHGTLHSDHIQVSPDAQRVWQSLAKRPSYQVSQSPGTTSLPTLSKYESAHDLTNLSGEPVFTAKFTTKTAGFQVAPSKIHGHGVFADTDMGIGDDLGLGLQIIPGALEGQPAFKRTTMGRYLNHTNDANAELFDAGDGMIHVRAIKPIAKADEVTLEYRSGMQCQQDVYDRRLEKTSNFTGSDGAGAGQSAVVPNRLVTGSGATPAGAENQPAQPAPNEALLQQAEMAPDDTLFDISSIKQATDLFMSEDAKTEEDSVGTDQGVEFTAHANNQMGVSGRRLPALLDTEGSPGTYQPSGSNEAQGKSKQPAGQGILNRGGGYSAAGPMSAPPVVRAPETETTGSSAPMTGPKAVFGYG